MDEMNKEMIEAYRSRYLAKIKTIEQLGNQDPGASQFVQAPAPEMGTMDYDKLIGTVYKGEDASWAIEEVANIAGSTMFYGGVANDVTMDTGTTEADIDAQLGGVFAGKGDLFMKYGNEYGINPAFLAAISMHETGNGTSNAVLTKNNVGGMMMTNPATGEYNLLRTYSSLEDGVRAMASNLKKNYINEGLISVEQIQKKYAPNGAANDPTGLNSNWVGGVIKFMDKMGAISQPVPMGTTDNSSVATSMTDQEYRNMLSKLKLDTTYFVRTGKIPLPSSSYGEYQVFTKQMVEANGITNGNYYMNIFGSGRGNRFHDYQSATAGGYLRKDLVYYLEILQARVAKATGSNHFKISSGYRNPGKNRAAGGSPNSLHMSAIAVDISAGSYDNAIIIANTAYYMNFGGIAIGKGNNYFVHLDIGLTRRFKYNGVGKYQSPTNTGR